MVWHDLIWYGMVWYSGCCWVGCSHYVQQAGFLMPPLRPSFITPNITAAYPPGSPSPLLDNIRVMVIAWRLRGNIIRTALCWIVWHNVHSPQHTYMSSSNRSNRLGLSHWDSYAVRRGGCLELYYCNMVEWLWWDSSLILTTNWFPPVLWHCWFPPLPPIDTIWAMMIVWRTRGDYRTARAVLEAIIAFSAMHTYY